MALLRSFLIIIFTVLICTGVGVGIIGLILYYKGFSLSTAMDFSKLAEEPDLLKYVLGINHLFTFIIAAIVCSWLLSKERFSSYAPLKSGLNMVVLLKCLGLMLLIYPVAGLLAYATSLLPLPQWASNLDKQNVEALSEILSMNTLKDLCLNLLIVGILPGLGEEMLFRGVIQNELQRLYKNSFWPLVFTAFIFSALHLDATGFLPKFCIGLVLGFVYYITGNLWYSILLHFLNNSLQVAILYFTNEEFTAPELTMTTGQIGFALLTLPFLYFLVKDLYQFKNKNSFYGPSA
jgi:uncharacterized protein